MKKFSKILCAILVLVMLCTSFAFVASADEFTPTATVEAFQPASVDSATNTAANAQDAANLVTQNFNNGKGEIDFYTVTRSDGTDYAVYVANKTGDPTGHIQWTFSDVNGTTYSYNEDVNKYLVYEIDLSTDDELLSLGFITNPMGYRSSGQWGGFASNGYRDIHVNDFGIEPGKFTHLTVIYDLNNNLCYVYADNDFVKSVKFTSDTAHEAWKNADAAYQNHASETFTYDYTQGMRLAFKLQAHSSYTNASNAKLTSLKEDASIFGDNAYLSEYDSATAGNLAAVLGGDLSAWDLNRFNADYATPVVPDLVEIDGVRYNNTHDANQALAFATTTKQVTLLRDSLKNIVVACDAVVTTNGLTCFTAAENCTLVDNGDGTVTVDAPFAENMTVTEMMTDSATVWNMLKYNAPDNIITHPALISGTTWGGVGARQTNFVIDVSTGTSIMHESMNGTELDGNKNEFFNLVVNNNTKIEMKPIEGKNQYAVLEFDFSAADYGNGMCIQHIHRNSGGGGLWAQNVWLNAYIPQSNEMVHVSIVYNYQDNDAYIFVDGIYTGVLVDAVMSTAGHSDYLSGTPALLECIRLGSNSTSDVYFDNLYYRVEAIDASNDGIAASIQQGSTDHWDGFLLNDPEFVPSEFPDLAIIDGQSYRDLAEVEALLSGNDSREAVILHKPATPIKVASNSVINTNGIENAIEVVAGTPSWNEDNTVCTVTGVPYISHIQKTDTGVKPNQSYVISTASPGNLFASGGSGNFLSGGTGDYANKQGSHFTFFDAHTLGSTDQYLGVYVNQDASFTSNSYNEGNWNNPFVTFDLTHKRLPVGENSSAYYVIDVDIGTYTDFIDDVNFSVIMKRGEDDGGYPYSGKLVASNFAVNSGEWNHITFVADMKNNQVYAFLNGEFVGMSDVAYDAAHVLDTTTELVLKAVRLELGRNFCAQTRTAGETLVLDNFAYRAYESSDLSLGLPEAIAAGSLKDWANFDNGRGGEKLASVGVVNGVEYYNFKDFEAALTTNDEVTAKLYAAPFAPISVRCNGTLDVSSFGTDLITAHPEASITIEGDIVTMSAPYMENKEVSHLLTHSDVLDITKYDALDNQIKQLYFISSSGNSDGNNCKWNTEGYRKTEVIKNNDTGDTIYKESVMGDTLVGENEYLQYYFYAPTYQAGKTTYTVLDYDIASDGLSDISIYYQIRGFSNTFWFGPVSKAATVNAYTGGKADTFAHVTVVIDFTNNYSHVFVNGNLIESLQYGAYGENNNGEFATKTISSFEFRIGSNTKNTYYFDNLYARNISVDPANDALASAVAAKDITVWGDNVYGTYDMPQFPAIASVDGVPYHDAASLSDALYGNVETPKQVEFFHSTDAKVLVSCDAVVNTNNCTLPGLSYARGTKVVDGKITTFDCNYISDTKTAQIHNYIDWSADIKLQEEGNLLDQLWYNTTNCFLNTSWTNNEGETVNSLNTYLVSPAGDSNKYGLIARAPIAEDEGSNLNNGMYFNWNFNIADEFYYSAEENNYWVYDFDTYIEGNALDMYAYNLIKQGDTFHYGSNEYANNISKLVVDNGYNGQFVHVTIVSDLNNNKNHVFINNEWVAVGAVAGNHEAILEASSDVVFRNHGFRMSFVQGDVSDKASFAIDNAYVKHIKTSTSANLADVLAAETPDLSSWTLARYNESYQLPAAPAIGTVDGVPHYGTESISAALAQPGNHEVLITRDYRGTIKVDGNAVINTQKLELSDVELAASGAHEFMLNGENAVASSKYAYSFDGAVHTVAVITAENYADHTTEVYWFTDPDSTDVYNVVYYVYGDQVVAPTVGGSFIQNGKLVTVEWFDYDDENRDTIVKFPVAGPELNSLNYACRRAEVDVDFAAQGILHQISINADFVLTLLVPKSETTTEGEIVSIDGVEYVKFSVSLKANETAKLLDFVFNVQDSEGNTYEQHESISVANYVKALLADASASEADKKLAYAALNYSNEVYKFFGGSANTELVTILEAHSELATAAPEISYTMNTTDLSGLLRAAALRLNASPEFVLKLAIGTKGTISLAYESAGEMTAVSKEFDATNGEVYVVFDNFNVYDIHKDITVTISIDGVDYTGTCNLAGYAFGLESHGHDNTFAKALLTYATLAEAHKLAEAAE